MDVSYLSDSVIAMAYYEEEAELRRAVTVVKNKHRAHLSTIHRMVMEGGRLSVEAQSLSHLGNIMVKAGAREAGRST